MKKDMARRRCMAVALTLVAATPVLASPSEMASVNADWKGAESFSPTGAAPNPLRCGDLPNLELTFAGQGIDNEGGSFAVVASGCLNTETNLIFDLEATDTYAGGDQIFIAAEPFVQVVDPHTCVATNEHRVAFDVAGGTGAYAGATGRGHFEFAVNHTPCNGLARPAYVWFEGKIRRAP